MKQWLKRFLYLLFFLVWLFVICLPGFAFYLAFNGDVTWGSDPNDQVRVFMLQDPAHEGVGLQWSRPAEDVVGCTRTSVRYLMWEGEGINSDSCSCDVVLDTAPPRCELPDG